MFKDSSEKNFLSITSDVFGWIYLIAWSVSFYGQLIENYRRHKVTGLKFDYDVYNLAGFIAYSAYTIVGYFYEEIGTGHIPPQDIFFAVHGVVITIVRLIQICYYYDKNDKNQTVGFITITYIVVLFWGEVVLLVVEFVAGNYNPIENNKFNSIIYLGWVKVFITLIKYMPQVYHNYKRKSTIGWNIHNIILDITGGSFSLGQNLVDSLNKNKTKPVDGGSGALNLAKFALSFETIVFDLIFLIQHFCLYKDSNSDLGQPRISVIQKKIIENEEPALLENPNQE